MANASTERQLSPDKTSLLALKQDLIALRAQLSHTWSQVEPQLQDLTVERRRSAENLVHYLALRQADIRPLQTRLAARGLSSLGRAEPNVMSSIAAVLDILDPAAASTESKKRSITLDEARGLLRQRTAQLLGTTPEGREVRIMVTLPSEAAANRDLVHSLIRGGMDVARINCAHDDEEAWLNMIRHIRDAEAEVGRSCRIEMDIAGPKIRTGPVAPGPRVLRVRPKRDMFGRLERPAYVWIVAESRERPAASAIPVIPVPRKFWKRLFDGAELRFTDTRGRKRSLLVEAHEDGGWLARCFKTAYIEAGTTLRIAGRSGSSSQARVGDLAPLEQYLLLGKGDHLTLTASGDGAPAILDPDGAVVTPAHISCTLPEAFDHIKKGESVWFDDGKIGGKVIGVKRNQVDVEITQAKIGGGKLRADKGINLPGTRLEFSSLTEKDRRDLEFVVQHADIVGYSFVRAAADVRELQEQLKKLGGERLGVVLKIETREAFDSLPDILLAAMRSSAAGVMIARGDLAIEAGYERMAEIQEEIMWLSEAAHMPLIWATQVLEQLSKKGLPSRAEISDAAMSERAECVMLNKGPYVVEAVIALNDILTRMQAHQQKKRSMLRRLQLADRFFEARGVSPPSCIGSSGLAP